MMNPLYRKMFRDPRAAKRATGILASSAPLMTAAQKAMAQGQPVKAQTGFSVRTQPVVPSSVMTPQQRALEQKVKSVEKQLASVSQLLFDEEMVCCERREGESCVAAK